MTSGGISPLLVVAMIRRFVILMVVSLLFAVCAAPAYSASVILDAQHQFQFATALMDRGEYDHAVLEYERLIQFFPENEAVPYARCFIGLCHMKAGKYEKAREVFKEIITAQGDDLLVQKGLFLIGESYYQQGIPKEAEYYFQRLFREFPRSRFRQAALYRLGWTKMQRDQWEEASNLFSRLHGENPYSRSAAELATASLRGKTLPLKSPKVAGTMAAVLPGLGHAYVGRYKDGSVAFLVNGLFIWAAVESFHHNNNVVGGMLTFLEIGWYSGNIYSAVNAAHKYNRKVKVDFRENLKDTVELKPLILSKGGAGLAFAFHF